MVEECGGSGLWRLLELFFKKKIDLMMKKGVRIRHSGRLDKLPVRIRKIISDTVERTRNNKTCVLNFCINYGGQQEIVDAVNTWLESRGRDEQLTLKKLEHNLYTRELPPVDCLIRTSGEFRISNFLLWQSAYAELVFMDVLWPDFKPAHLYRAIYEYQQRERRFGGL